MLSEHFKKLNNDENIYDEHDKKFVDVNVGEWSVNKYINEDFCQSEIRKIVNDLKNNKSQEKKCKLKLKEHYTEEWKNCLENSSKCYLYKGFKPELKLEEYLCKLPNDLRINLTKFRLCNHKLPIEIGRHKHIDRNYRICTLCDKHDLGDEYHYMLICVTN